MSKWDEEYWKKSKKKVENIFIDCSEHKYIELKIDDETYTLVLTPNSDNTDDGMIGFDCEVWESKDM